MCSSECILVGRFSRKFSFRSSGNSADDPPAVQSLSHASTFVRLLKLTDTRETSMQLSDFGASTTLESLRLEDACQYHFDTVILFARFQALFVRFWVVSLVEEGKPLFFLSIFCGTIPTPYQEGSSSLLALAPSEGWGRSSLWPYRTQSPLDLPLWPPFDWSLPLAISEPEPTRVVRFKTCPFGRDSTRTWYFHRVCQQWISTCV